MRVIRKVPKLVGVHDPDGHLGNHLNELIWGGEASETTLFVLAHRLLVSILVNDQTPVPTLRRGGAKVLEIKSEDRKVMAFGVSHDRGIGKAEVEIPELCINLGCTPYQTVGHESDVMFSLRHRAQKRDPRGAVNLRPEQVIYFNDDGVRYDKLSPQLGHQGGCEIMSMVPAIRSSDDRSCVGHHPQSLETSSRR